MRKRSVVTFLAALAAVFGLTTAVWACDGWDRVEKKFRPYEQMNLTSAQRKAIDDLKQKAVAGFSDDHQHGRCHADHEAMLARYAAEADKLILNAKSMDGASGASSSAAAAQSKQLEALQNEIRSLRGEIAELRTLVTKLLAIQSGAQASQQVDVPGEIERLWKLRQAGALSEQEFANAKAKLLR